ncbi:hypothetical protein QJ850_gp831 [Acanthamoeba polyphaga mimivirus]|uniref:Uncharacterized protein n=1 Tax=Acanthamoeba polyphaga mimivirus Kroon TaxID=3069720 RepID=A0A0G2Y297_9VIRU|nr:hypothetical protein QJ850_gp831 [Acanthamoeba polyphaga mimivirus]AKI79868.1 hypothetical protein [Acanthamoeba polyphaga mimivirus Kroon]
MSVDKFVYCLEINGKSRVFEVTDLGTLFLYIQHNLDEFKELFEIMIYTNSELKNLMAPIYSSNIKTSKEYFNETNWSNTKNIILNVIKSTKPFDFFHQMQGFCCNLYGSGNIWGKIRFYRLDKIHRVPNNPQWITPSDLDMEEIISDNQRVSSKEFKSKALKVISQKYIENHQKEINEHVEKLWTLHKELRYI